MWVLENSPINEVRARKIDKQELAGGNASNGPVSGQHLLLMIFTVLAIGGLFLTIRFIVVPGKQRLHFKV